MARGRAAPTVTRKAPISGAQDLVRPVIGRRSCPDRSEVRVGDDQPATSGFPGGTPTAGGKRRANARDQPGQCAGCRERRKGEETGQTHALKVWQARIAVYQMRLL